MENKDEEKIQDIKVPFFKKIWYSVGKINKYPEMIKEGWRSAVKYLALLMIIFSLICSGFSTYSTYSYIQETHKYLEEKVPELEYKNEILTAQNEEKVELENDFIKNNFGGKIIIDTKTEDENKINEYINSFEKNIGYVLLSNKIYVVNLEKEGHQEYTYQEFFNKYFNRQITEFNKQDILDYIQSQSNGSIDYYLQYLLTYWIYYFVVFSVYIFIATIILFVFNKILKINKKISEIYAITIYGFTSTIILYLVYMIFNYFTKITVPYLEQILVIVGILYATTILYKGKK